MNLTIGSEQYVVKTGMNQLDDFANPDLYEWGAHVRVRVIPLFIL